MIQTAQLPVPEWIWSIESVFEFLAMADELIARPIDTDDGDGLANRIAELTALFPASYNTLAACKWYEQSAYKYEVHLYADELKQRAGEVHKPLVAPSILRDYLKSRTAELQALYERADRTNAALTHTIEGMRSILSKVKEDRRHAAFAGNLR